MLYRPFAKLGWPVSAVGLGTWNIGNQWGEIDDATAWATIGRALDCGVNLFDTAESYGNPYGLSEERLGIALAGMRHRVYIVSKIGHYGKRHGFEVPKTHPGFIILCADACLGRLRTDWLDLLLCHEWDLEEPGIYLEAFEALKQKGKIRAYGISTDSLEVLKRFNSGGGCDAVEVDYSLLNRAPEHELLPYCQEHGIAVLARGPLRRGLLSGRYDASSVFTDSVRSGWNKDGKERAALEAEIARVERLKQVLQPGEEMIAAALRYVISHPAMPVAIPGAKSPAQAGMNAAAGERLLTAEERERLIDALQAI